MKYDLKTQSGIAKTGSLLDYKQRISARTGIKMNSFKIKDGFVIIKSKMNKK